MTTTKALIVRADGTTARIDLGQSTLDVIQLIDPLHTSTGADTRNLAQDRATGRTLVMLALKGEDRGLNIPAWMLADPDPERMFQSEPVFGDVILADVIDNGVEFRPVDMVDEHLAVIEKALGAVSKRLPPLDDLDALESGE